MMEFLESVRPLAESYVPTVLFDAAIKGAVILTLATILTLTVQRAPASLRHLVWSLSVAALVALPFVTAVAPQWTAPGLPRLTPPSLAPAAVPSALPEASQSAVPEALPSNTPPSIPREDLGKREGRRGLLSEISFVSRSVGGEGAEESATQPAASRGAVAGAGSSEVERLTGASQLGPVVNEIGLAGGGRQLAWTAWALLLWTAVALLIIAGIGLGVLRIWLIGRAARSISSGPLLRLTGELSAKIGLRRRVWLLQCRGRCVPLTWGVIKPRILLPSEAIDWPTARLRAVLLHELAHVRRYDFLTQLLAQLACALHWFNPLVWHAAKKLREEGELASDDQVLRAGSLPSDYAGHLLEVARSLRTEPLASLAAVAMARSSQLSDRLRAVLEEGRAHAELSGRAKLSSWLCAALILIPIAGASPGASGPRVGGLDDGPPVKPGLVELSAEMPEPQLTWTAMDIGESSQPALLQVADCDWMASGGGSSSSVNIDDDRMKIELRRGDCELSVDLVGEIRFNASFTEIASLSRGGELEIEEARGRESRRLLLERDGGQLTRTWYVDRRERPYDAEAQAWLSDMLLVLFRRAGLQAEERAAYILAQDGVDGLLREISQIPSDYTARKYYTVLLSQAELEPEQVREIVRQAGEEIDSDYELAELLIAVAENQPLDESVRIAYVEAAGSIGSDYEHRRVLSVILKREALSSELAQAMLVSAKNIDSDYELAELLIELLQLRPLDEAMTDGFFDVAGSLDSDYETRRVLEAALREGAPSRSALDRTLQAAAGIGSDYELAELLVLVADLYPMDSRLPDSYVTAARSIDSGYELGRVLMTLLARGNLSSATLVSILEVAATIKSNHELGEMLAALARDYRIDDSVRPAFFRAADTISGDYERQAVLTTVLREQTLDDPLVAAVLESALKIESDFDLASLLLELVDRHPVGGNLRPAFDRAVETISSKYERDRVLSAAYRS